MNATTQRVLWLPVVLMVRLARAIVLILAWGTLVILMVLNDEGNSRR